MPIHLLHYWSGLDIDNFEDAVVRPRSYELAIRRESDSDDPIWVCVYSLDELIILLSVPYLDSLISWTGSEVFSIRRIANQVYEKCMHIFLNPMQHISSQCIQYYNNPVLILLRSEGQLLAVGWVRDGYWTFEPIVFVCSHLCKTNSVKYFHLGTITSNCNGCSIWGVRNSRYLMW